MVELEEQGPAMTALGSLLKLTEVFLWDDGSKETKDRSFSMGQTKPARDGSGEGSNLLDSECGTLPEDMELTKQMNALGLPVSFLTNKEKRNRKAEGKRKGMRLKHPVTSQGYVVEALESSKRMPLNFSASLLKEIIQQVQLRLLAMLPRKIIVMEYWVLFVMMARIVILCTEVLWSMTQ